MIGLQAASRARQWATLGMTASNAQYALLRLFKGKELDATARSYAQEGKELFTLLGAAAQTTQVSGTRQLAALAAMEPIRHPAARKPIEDDQIKKVLELFEEILKCDPNGGTEERLTRERLTEALGIVQRLSDAYAEQGFSELQELRKTYERSLSSKIPG